LSEAEEPDQPALDEHVKWADVLVGEVTRWPWEKPHERKQVNFPEIRGGRSSRYLRYVPCRSPGVRYILNSLAT
jgi:hypothetical protein